MKIDETVLQSNIRWIIATEWLVGLDRLLAKKLFDELHF